MDIMQKISILIYNILLPRITTHDIVELIMEFEKEFDIQIPDDQAENIATVGQAVKYIEDAKQ